MMTQWQMEPGAWDKEIDNPIHDFMWDVITHPCPNFNSSLIKLLLKLGNGWVITSHLYVDIIVYPCPYLDVCFGNLCY